MHCPRRAPSLGALWTLFTVRVAQVRFNLSVTLRYRLLLCVAQVQNNLNKLERDAKLISTTIEDLLVADKSARAANFKG